MIRTTISLALACLTAACGGGDHHDKPSDVTPPPAGATVTIKRDGYGVPHIYADTVRDLYYGYGYAVAQDRLFQMEMARRSVMGTAAEVLGSSELARDRASRQASDFAAIQTQLDALPAADRDIFEGYAAGYNARLREVLQQRDTLLPKQFTDFGFDPEPWTSLDVAMIWVGTMANRFSSGNSEVANLKLLNDLIADKGAAVGRQLFEQMRWLEDVHAPTTVPRATTRQNTQVSKTLSAHQQQLAAVSSDIFHSVDAVDAARKGIAAPEARPVASNLWIAGPEKTTDGSTVFINGPQFGWVNPAYVFAVGLHGAGFDVTGNSPFGYPAVLFGTNGKITWGSTAGPLDVNDTYQYRLNPDNPYEYFYQGAFRPMVKTTEIIKVKGAPDETVDIYSTVHGRVTSMDTANGTAYALKKSWAGHEVQTLLAWIQSTKAQNWDEWLAQAKKFAITNNWYFADSTGAIGYASPGFLPKRPASQDIRLPALGDGTMEWEGIRPFSDNPQMYQPVQGYVVNWNNQSAPGVLTDGGNYSAADRMNELKLRLEAQDKLTPEAVWALNETASLADVNARYFIPMIVAAAADLPQQDAAYQAAQTLGAWDMINRSTLDANYYDGAAPTIMRAWLRNMHARVLQDDLPASVYPSYANPGYFGATTQASANIAAGTKLVYNALLGQAAGVPQTIDFLNGETPQAVILDVLQQTVAELQTRFGDDPAQWLTPVTRQEFAPTNFIGYPQAGADERLSLPFYMNRGTQNDRVTFSASGDVRLCTVAPPGQSGFISPSGEKSPHYDDQMSLYQNFDCKEEALSAADIDGATRHVQVLQVSAAQ